MNIAKKIFVQSMAISTAILFLNGINAFIQHFAGNDISLQWYHPVTIVLTGILCALPTVLLRDEGRWDRKTFWIRAFRVVCRSGRIHQRKHHLLPRLCFCLAFKSLAGQAG